MSSVCSYCIVRLGLFADLPNLDCVFISIIQSVPGFTRQSGCTGLLTHCYLAFVLQVMTWGGGQWLGGCCGMYRTPFTALYILLVLGLAKKPLMTPSCQPILWATWIAWIGSGGHVRLIAQVHVWRPQDNILHIILRSSFTVQQDEGFTLTFLILYHIIAFLIHSARLCVYSNTLPDTINRLHSIKCTSLLSNHGLCMQWLCTFFVLSMTSKYNYNKIVLAKIKILNYWECPTVERIQGNVH